MKTINFLSLPALWTHHSCLQFTSYWSRRTWTLGARRQSDHLITSPFLSITNQYKGMFCLALERLQQLGTVPLGIQRWAFVHVRLAFNNQFFWSNQRTKYSQQIFTILLTKKSHNSEMVLFLLILSTYFFTMPVGNCSSPQISLLKMHKGKKSS